MTNKLMGTIFMALLLAAPVFTQEPAPQVAQTPVAQADAEMNAAPEETPAAPEPLKVLRDYRGIRLDMPMAEVRATLGEPARSDQGWDEFKLGKSDLMTVRYDNGVVKVIQLYFTDADRAPEFVEVVGDVELMPKDNGAQFARRVIADEHFWVSMYQSGDKKITSVSLGRQP